MQLYSFQSNMRNIAVMHGVARGLPLPLPDQELFAARSPPHMGCESLA